MTAEICTKATSGVSKQLRDTRDGKYYWVSKLADGKCWMTQNLDLDLSTSVALTPEDSDVSTNWSASYATATAVNASTILSNNTGTRSWSLGDYRLKNPTASSDCGYPKNDASQCASQFTTYATPTTANADADAHYILGNHYQWNAATAGTGGTITAGQASDSICPKGWRLPVSNTMTAGSFGGLTSAASIGTTVSKLTAAPYYFVRGGIVEQSTSRLFNVAGAVGYYWSSTPYSSVNNAYSLDFGYTSNINPSNNYGRYYGLSVRCIAR